MAFPGSSGAIYDEARRLAAEGRTAVVATVVDGEPIGGKALVEGGVILKGSLGSSERDRAIQDLDWERGRTPKPGLIDVVDGVRVFFDVFEPSPQLIIFGAVHTAQALDWFARKLGYRVVVVDARRALATRERFPDTDQLVIAWPADAYQQVTVTASSAIAILSHDPKFDEPALLGALNTDARYIGAVGSRQTNTDRRQRLLAAGVSAEQIARIRGPIGLDLGGDTPEEMALSILAEMTAVTYGREGRPLSHLTGAIRGE
jgi:xanthine dehydrogenase accessory factor